MTVLYRARGTGRKTQKGTSRISARPFFYIFVKRSDCRFYVWHYRSLLLQTFEYMKVISFLHYYIKLRLNVLLGVHQTVNPLGLRWRWREWSYNYKSRRRRIG